MIIRVRDSNGCYFKISYFSEFSTDVVQWIIDRGLTVVNVWKKGEYAYGNTK